MLSRKWNRQEVDKLARYYANSSNHAIAVYLGRTPISVKRKAHRLGLHKNSGFSRNPWRVISMNGRKRNV